MTQEYLDKLTFTINEAQNLICVENAHLKDRRGKNLVHTTVNIDEFNMHQHMCQILIDMLTRTGKVVCADVSYDYFKLGVFESSKIAPHYLPVNASQLSLLLIFSFQMKNLDANTVMNWAEEFSNVEQDPEIKDKLFKCLHQYYKEITSLSVKDCQVLTYQEQGQLLPAIMGELLTLVQNNDSSLYFNFSNEYHPLIEDCPDYSVSYSEDKYVKLENVSMLYHVVTHYEPKLKLPAFIHYKWIDSVIQMLDKTEDRQIFYTHLNQWVSHTPAHAVQWLVMQYCNDNEKLLEVLKYVPQNVTSYELAELKKIFDFFLNELPDYYQPSKTEDNNVLIKYLWFNRHKINAKSTEKSVFFNFIKDEYPYLIEKLNFLTATQRYHELGQTGNLFDKKYHFSVLRDDDAGMELILNFKTVHEMLLLKESGAKEIEKWFNQKVFPYVQGNDLMSNWKIQYLSYQTTTDDDGLIRLYWRDKPQFTKAQMQKSLGEFFRQIRQENPTKIEDVSMDYPKWFSACWRHLKLAPLVEDNNTHDMDTDEDTAMDKIRLKI
jgi:hypothetical protein